MAKTKNQIAAARAGLALCVFLMAGAGPLQLRAQPMPPETQLEKLMDGFGVIWGLELLSEDEALVAVKSGELFRVHFKKHTRTKIGGMPQVSTTGQAGLLDIRLAPDYGKTRRLYFTYSKATAGGDTTALGQARYNPGDSAVSNRTDLFVAKTENAGAVHFGSRITFDNEGHVFFGIGDRGQRDKAQDLGWHNGKILRLNLDGSVPKDNPFVSTQGARPEIYSYGHRNPQGLFFSPSQKKLFSCEHGPRGGDEINEIRRGLNYGWPVVTHGREYFGPKIGEGTSKNGMQPPLKVYVPSIAPSSLILYESGRIKAFTRSFILGALVLEHLNVVSQDGLSEKRYFSSLSKRIRQVIETPSGQVLFTTDSGEIYRISAVKP